MAKTEKSEVGAVVPQTEHCSGTSQSGIWLQFRVAATRGPIEGTSREHSILLSIEAICYFFWFQSSALAAKLLLLGERARASVEELFCVGVAAARCSSDFKVIGKLVLVVDTNCNVFDGGFETHFPGSSHWYYLPGLNGAVQALDFLREARPTLFV